MSDMKENLELLSRSLYRLPVAELTDEQLHAVVARAVLARLQPAWQGSLQAHCAGRRAYYFSAEYLLGKAVYNNLLCTGLTGEVEAVSEFLRHHNVIGFNTYGEQFDGMHINQTFTGVVIGQPDVRTGQD